MGKVEYREEDRERERWMCGIRLAAGLLGGAGQKQFTQNMVKTSLPYFGVKLSCVCLMFAYRKK